MSVSRRVEAPIDSVWRLVANARGYAEWAAMTRSTLEVEGSPEPDGVGAIRNFGTTRVISREQVVAFDPPVDGRAHLGYVLLSGLPVRDYHADVDLVSAGSGTEVTWRSSFEVDRAWLRPVMTAFLRVVLGDFCRRLAKHAPALSARV